MDHLDETTIGLFLEQRLSEERARGFERHMDGCATCRRLVGEIVRTSPLAEGSSDAPAASATRTRGDRIGRYLVLDLVGAGAMGAVYAAFDPDLDRKVALKVLHAGAAASEAQRTRLLREAQALARVSHAGVVAVHDVGSIGDQIFIAMEFIGGGTLKTWLAERRRSWREIVTVVAAAGRGLEAAHAAGLVHRDVKPDNILIDGNGVARIGDFGLAGGSGEAPKRPSDPRVVASASTFATELTVSGTILGTPAYMSPEQLAAAPATPRSDQFSFCATLHEALFGERPYPGASIDQIMDAMKHGRLAEPDAKRASEVPGRIRSAIARGLSVDPEARHASMTNLLAALAHDRWSRRRIVTVAIAGAFVVGGGAFAAIELGTHPKPCTTSTAEAARVWNAERRGHVRAAIITTKLPFAADSADRVDRALEAYATSWAVAHREACEATAVHRTQSPELLDRRMTCLDQRRLELDATIGTLATSNRESVRHAVEVATRLPSLAGCSDPRRLGAVAPRPTDPAIVAEIESIERDIARARVLDHEASSALAIEVAGEAVRRAERVGYAPLIGAAYFALGSAQVPLGPPKATRESFEHAIAAATTGGDEETEARALANLAMVLRHDSPDGAVATNQIRQAMAIVERSRRDPLFEAEIRYAGIQVLAGIEQPAVEDHLKHARERLTAAAANGADTRRLELELEQVEAFLEISAGAALAKLAVALHTAEQLYGPAHPEVAAVLVNMSYYAVIDDRADEARGYAARAAEILAPYPGNRVALRRIDAALETDAAKRRQIREEIVKLSEAAYGSHSPQLASDRELLADDLLELGDYRAGLAQIDATIAIWESAYGGHYEKMITSLVTKAQLLAALEDWNGEAAAAERANAIVDHGGMRELTKTMAKLLLVDVYFRQRRFAESLSTLEAIMPLLKLVTLGDREGALLDFYLAACKWELGRDRPTELRNARAAFATLRTAPKPDKQGVAFMAEWLAGK